MMLEQQKMMIESANFDAGVVKTIITGKDALKQINKGFDIEDFAAVKDELDEILEEHDERQKYFADIALEDNDDLQQELDELEKDLYKDDINKLDVKFKPINISNTAEEE